MNRAPASTASSTCSGRTTVPAPTSSVGLGGDAPDRVGGDRRPERDLGDRQAALGEGRRNRHRGLELLEHDDRDDATAQKRTQDVVLSHLLPR